MGKVENEDDQTSEQTEKTSKGQVKNRANRNKSEKDRRDKLNDFINELASMVPGCSSPSRKMDKATVLRNTVDYMKVHNDLTVAITCKDTTSCLSSNELGQLMLEGSYAFLFVLSLSGTFKFFSESVSDLMGYSRDELLQKNVFDHILPDDKLVFMKQLARDSKTAPGKSFNTGSSTFYVRMARKSKGFETRSYETLHCTSCLRTVKQDDLQEVKSTSEEERTGSANKENCFVVLAEVVSPYRYRDISNWVNEEVEFSSRQRLDGKFLYLDPRCIPITGYLPYEILGSVMYDYIHSDDLESIAKSFELLIELGEGETGNYRILTKGCQWIVIQTSSYISYNHWNSKPEFICSTHKLVRNPDKLASDSSNLKDTSVQVHQVSSAADPVEKALWNTKDLGSVRGDERASVPLLHTLSSNLGKDQTILRDVTKSPNQLSSKSSTSTNTNIVTSQSSGPPVKPSQDSSGGVERNLRSPEHAIRFPPRSSGTDFESLSHLPVVSSVLSTPQQPRMTNRLQQPPAEFGEDLSGSHNIVAQRYSPSSPAIPQGYSTSAKISQFNVGMGDKSPQSARMTPSPGGLSDGSAQLFTGMVDRYSRSPLGIAQTSPVPTELMDKYHKLQSTIPARVPQTTAAVAEEYPQTLSEIPVHSSARTFSGYCQLPSRIPETSPQFSAEQTNRYPLSPPRVSEGSPLSTSSIVDRHSSSPTRIQTTSPQSNAKISDRYPQSPAQISRRSSLSPGRVIDRYPPSPTGVPSRSQIPSRMVDRFLHSPVRVPEGSPQSPCQTIERYPQSPSNIPERSPLSPATIIAERYSESPTQLRDRRSQTQTRLSEGPVQANTVMADGDMLPTSGTFESSPQGTVIWNESSRQQIPNNVSLLPNQPLYSRSTMSAENRSQCEMQNFSYETGNELLREQVDRGRGPCMRTAQNNVYEESLVKDTKLLPSQNVHRNTPEQQNVSNVSSPVIGSNFRAGESRRDKTEGPVQVLPSSHDSRSSRTESILSSKDRISGFIDAQKILQEQLVEKQNYLESVIESQKRQLTHIQQQICLNAQAQFSLHEIKALETSKRLHQQAHILEQERKQHETRQKELKSFVFQKIHPTARNASHSNTDQDYLLSPNLIPHETLPNARAPEQAHDGSFSTSSLTGYSGAMHQPVTSNSQQEVPSELVGTQCRQSSETLPAVTCCAPTVGSSSSSSIHFGSVLTQSITSSSLPREDVVTSTTSISPLTLVDNGTVSGQSVDVNHPGLYNPRQMMRSKHFSSQWMERTQDTHTIVSQNTAQATGFASASHRPVSVALSGPVSHKTIPSLAQNRRTSTVDAVSKQISLSKPGVEVNTLNTTVTQMMSSSPQVTFATTSRTHDYFSKFSSSELETFFSTSSSHTPGLSPGRDSSSSGQSEKGEEDAPTTYDSLLLQQKQLLQMQEDQRQQLLARQEEQMFRIQQQQQHEERMLLQLQQTSMNSPEQRELQPSTSSGINSQARHTDEGLTFPSAPEENIPSTYELSEEDHCLINMLLAESNEFGMLQEDLCQLSTSSP